LALVSGLARPVGDLGEQGVGKPLPLRSWFFSIKHMKRVAPYSSFAGSAASTTDPVVALFGNGVLLLPPLPMGALEGRWSPGFCLWNNAGQAHRESPPGIRSQMTGDHSSSSVVTSVRNGR